MSLRPSARCALTAALAWVAVQLPYWAATLSLRDRIGWDARGPYWTSGAAGAFLPWPHPPGMLAVIVPITDPADILMAYLVDLLLWVPWLVGTGAAVFLGVRRLLRRLDPAEGGDRTSALT